MHNNNTAITSSFLSFLHVPTNVSTSFYVLTPSSGLVTQQTVISSACHKLLETL
jgi:hypothetical protein